MAETIRLITEWSTDDPTLAETLRLIQETPLHEPVRHEMEAALHTFQARLAWQRAEQLRAPAARRLPALTGACSECGWEGSLNRIGGGVRKHYSGVRFPGAVPCPGSGQPPRSTE